MKKKELDELTRYFRERPASSMLLKSWIRYDLSVRFGDIRRFYSGDELTFLAMLNKKMLSGATITNGEYARACIILRRRNEHEFRSRVRRQF